MIWLTWRQFRAQAIAAAAALVVLAVIFGVTEPHLAHLYHVSGLATCRTNCAALSSTFVANMKADAIYPVPFIAGLGVLYLAPALIGLFWGAPLVTRELEAGTFRLAWNQSLPVAGDRDLRRPGSRPSRVLRLVDPPPPPGLTKIR